MVAKVFQQHRAIYEGQNKIVAVNNKKQTTSDNKTQYKMWKENSGGVSGVRRSKPQQGDKSKGMFGEPG